MDYQYINYDIIEEAFMNAESKDQLYQIFVASATGKLRNDVTLMNQNNLPETLKKIPESLSLTQEKALTLIISLHNLMMQYMALCVPTQDETVLAEKLPEAMQKQVKTFLFKQMRAAAPLTKNYVQDQFTGTSKMVDFDWRLDFKISSKQQERMKQPVLYVKLELDKSQKTEQDGAGSNEHQDVLFQVSKGQLKNIIDNFEDINQTLSGLAETMGGGQAD